MSKAKNILSMLESMEPKATVIATKPAPAAPVVEKFHCLKEARAAMNESYSKAKNGKEFKEALMLIVHNIPDELLAGDGEELSPAVTPGMEVTPSTANGESMKKWEFLVPKARIEEVKKALKAKLNEDDAEVTAEPDGKMQVLSQEDVESIVMSVLADLDLLPDDFNQCDDDDQEGEEGGDDDMQGEAKAGKVSKPMKIKARATPKPAHPPKRANEDGNVNPTDPALLEEVRSSAKGAQGLMKSMGR